MTTQSLDAFLSSRPLTVDNATTLAREHAVDPHTVRSRLTKLGYTKDPSSFKWVHPSLSSTASTAPLPTPEGTFEALLTLLASNDYLLAIPGNIIQAAATTLNSVDWSAISVRPEVATNSDHPDNQLNNVYPVSYCYIKPLQKLWAQITNDPNDKASNAAKETLVRVLLALLTYLDDAGILPLRGTLQSSTSIVPSLTPQQTAKADSKHD